MALLLFLPDDAWCCISGQGYRLDVSGVEKWLVEENREDASKSAGSEFVDDRSDGVERVGCCRVDPPLD